MRQTPAGKFFRLENNHAQKPLVWNLFAVWHYCCLAEVKWIMVEALFNQPNYLAAKKTLDAVALRHEAIASNLANLETPGYKRQDLAPNFLTELNRACASQNAQQISSLHPTLAVDSTALPMSRDGNTVCLEQEMAGLNQNSMVHNVETQLVSNTLIRLRMAITGKSA